jgi:hypothetical protein
MVKRADGQPIKRDAFEAFALQHVLDQRDAKRSRRNSIGGTLRQTWTAIRQEAELSVENMPLVTTLPCSIKVKSAIMSGRCRAYFKGKRQPCPCCGERVLSIVHWRLGCPSPAAERFRTAAHNRLVSCLAEAIRRGYDPPTYMFVNAGKQQQTNDWTVPQELLPHLPPPGRRGFSDTPDIMCVGSEPPEVAC